jgi:phospholipid/cholesterol/gamma-HCH transport system permease protein
METSLTPAIALERVRSELDRRRHVLFGAVVRIPMLRLQPVRDEFIRQVYFTGVTAVGGMVTRGAMIGTLIIAYVIGVLEADAALAVRILLLVVLREMGPLLAAVLVIQRSGTAIATELALMKISGEVGSLMALRVSPVDYLVVPRVAAAALALVVLTFYVQMIAVLGGMLLSSIIIDASYDELLSQFFLLASPGDLLYSMAKSLLFGTAIAAIACHHGLHAPGNSINAVPKAAVRAVMESTMVVMMLNAIFAYLVYGRLLFGLIKAES